MEQPVSNYSCPKCGGNVVSGLEDEHVCDFPCRQCKQHHEDGLPHKGMRCPACKAGCVPLKKRNYGKRKGVLASSVTDAALDRSGDYEGGKDG